ncbi:MAG: DUF4430 domain-containing protein [Patescibacteria group bacterium]
MKLLIKIIILAAIFCGGVYVGQKGLWTPPINLPSVNQAQLEQEIKVNLMLDFGDGQVQTFNNVALTNQATVLDLLKKVTTDSNLEFKTKDYGKELGVLVESINKYTNSDKTNQFWHYWVDNIYAETGASNYSLKNGDIVEWKYVSNQFNLIKH